MKKNDDKNPIGPAGGPAKRRTRLIQLLYDRPLPVLSVLLVLGFGGVALYAFHLSSNLIESNAIVQASRTSQMLKAFRTIYTSDVVDRLKDRGVEIRHDFESQEGAIPLPATLSIKLGEHVGALGTGLEASLYSPYPFPWRKTEGGLRDDFREAAWQHLLESPDLPYFRFEEYRGRASIRYATADRMRAECVQCHNTHPQTPKTGWREGDVRGVLEVILPLDTIRDETDSALRNTMGLLALAAVFGVGILALAFSQLRDGARQLEQKVEEHSLALEESEASRTEQTRFRADLENQVEERTAELKERAESEASLTAFSSSLQMEATAESIAKVALSYIVKRTEAPSGALYVLGPDGRLHRSAEHALPVEADQDVFPVGSGSIGHAAGTKQIQVVDPGERKLSVTFGLGQTTPRHIVTCPLLASDQVTGVVELYLFTEFDDTQRQCLTQASEITGSALRLAQQRSDKDRADEQIRRILESTPDCMVITNDQGEIVFANTVAATTFQYSRDDLVGRPVTDLLPERYRSGHGAKVSGFVASPHVREMGTGRDLFALRNDGTEFPVQISLSPIESDEGLLVAAAVRDITNMKAEQARMRKLSQATEQSPALVVITDRDGNIEYVNPKFTEVTGYTAEEALGRNPRFLKSGRQSKDFYKNLWDTILEGDEWHGEFCNLRKNGEEYWERASISPIRDDSGDVSHFVAVKEDITERKARRDRATEGETERS